MMTLPQEETAMMSNEPETLVEQGHPHSPLCTMQYQRGEVRNGAFTGERSRHSPITLVVV